MKDKTTPPPVASAPLPEVGAAEVPVDAEGLTKEINRGVARALKCATTPKEITDAVKAATEWYTARYGSEGDDELGTAFASQGGNGHHG